MQHPKDIHMIGSAHLDPVWLWPWTEGMSEIKSTFKAALDRLEEFPDFVFTCSSASYYEWLEEAFPDLFAKIQKYVAEGRWVIVNGWYVQPDLNLPCGESFARQSLYSQRYYLEKFGKLCDVGYNVDSFGHSAMLPQILRKSGMKSYIFSRPRPNENTEIPEIFTWESADGSQVTGVRLFTYGGPNRQGISYPELLQDRIDGRRNTPDDLPRMYFYGVVNHGGGPTIATLKELDRIRAEDKHVLYSSPGAYVEALEGAELPVWKDDLQIHAIGCYTAHLPVKQQNRRAETGLLSAEAFGAIAHMILGTPQKPEKLKDAWKRVMFNQFHDLICGCSIPQAYRDADASYGYAQQIANEQSNRALQQISWQIDTLGDDDLPCSKDEDFRLWGFAEKGSPLVIFNPLPFPVELPMEAGRIHDRITDAQGNPVLVQKVRNAVTSADVGWFHQDETLFLAKLPALGYATYWLHKSPHENEPDDALICRKDLLENRFLKVEFDETTGCIAQITRKDTGKTYLSGLGAAGVVIDERHSDTWGHALFEYRDEIGRFQMERAECLDFGPVRARLRITSTFGDSIMRADYVLDRDAKHLDIRMNIHWREKHRMLKLEFPISVESKKYTAEIPYGIIERAADGTEKPLQRWLDVSGGDRGLCVVNDSTHGADVLDNTLRLTVLRSPKFADHNGARDENGQRDSYGEFTEQGERFVSFRLLPHDGDWRTGGAMEHAAILNTPLHPVYETYHKGNLPQTLTGIRIPEGINAVALKEAEDGDAYVLRCQEVFGQDRTVQLELPIIDRSWDAAFSHFEIKTFRIPYDRQQPVTELDLLERPWK